MTRAPDSSVCVAALVADHDAHEHAAAALDECEAIVAYVAAETYSVLTRLPPPHRLDPQRAVEMIARRLPAQTIALSADACRESLRLFASAHVLGGAIYDGLIALAARGHDLELVSRDGRAARTYRALGARFVLLS
ncbi:MAG: PIN domain-containing protein [Solirubrobacteraceae bacterium]